MATRYGTRLEVRVKSQEVTIQRGRQGLVSRGECVGFQGYGKRWGSGSLHNVGDS